MNNKMTATWDGGLRFVHTSVSGHALVTDAPETSGGTDTAPSPLELILLGVIGCTGVDVATILTRMKEPLAGLEVSAEFERADEHPRVYTKIHLIYRLRGALDEKKVRRAIELSETKYCSASAMVGKTATITHEFSIEA
jgi:putative redox protein